MKKIPLSGKKGKGLFVLVDDDIFDNLSRVTWLLSTSGYAVRRQYIRGSGYRTKDHKTITVRMHRLINNTPEGLFTDHINRNKLDNRRCNLRTVNKKQNAFNTKLFCTNTSGFKGVYWEKYTQKWRAELKLNYKKISLGRFEKIEDAIEARKKAEERYCAI
jgi:hypothetical protein